MARLPAHHVADVLHLPQKLQLCWEAGNENDICNGEAILRQHQAEIDENLCLTWIGVQAYCIIYIISLRCLSLKFKYIHNI